VTIKEIILLIFIIMWILFALGVLLYTIIKRFSTEEYFLQQYNTILKFEEEEDDTTDNKE
jgi:membrane protein insertase Oxa1/YidC/SpoIIIJ